MTKIKQPCSGCAGSGTVPHIPRTLQTDEIQDPAHLDTFKKLDICVLCWGSGKRLVDIDVPETKPAVAGWVYTKFRRYPISSVRFTRR